MPLQSELAPVHFQVLSRSQNQGVVLEFVDVTILQNLNTTACRLLGLWFLPSNNSRNCLLAEILRNTEKWYFRFTGEETEWKSRDIEWLFPPSMRKVVKGLDFEVAWVSNLTRCGSYGKVLTLLDPSFLSHDLGQLMTYPSGWRRDWMRIRVWNMEGVQNG